MIRKLVAKESYVNNLFKELGISIPLDGEFLPNMDEEERGEDGDYPK